MESENIVLESGNVVQGVPRHCICHSPDGFSWGYGGSGPADLALNILEEYFVRNGAKGLRVLTGYRRHKCFDIAFRLHQKFKEDFLLAMPQEGGIITWEEVHKWVMKEIENE